MLNRIASERFSGSFRCLAAYFDMDGLTPLPLYLGSLVRALGTQRRYYPPTIEHSTTVRFWVLSPTGSTILCFLWARGALVVYQYK